MNIAYHAGTKIINDKFYSMVVELLNFVSLSSSFKNSR